MLPKLFSTFSTRYATRPGGYTRIHKLGNRPGDNAPLAVVELVDNPHDIKLDMTARAVGRELLTERLRHASPTDVAQEGVGPAMETLRKELKMNAHEHGQLRSGTRRNLQKVMMYKGKEALTEFSRRALTYAVRHCRSLWIRGLICVP